MTWTAYRVVFKLKSPMHIGCGKVGNVQRTRPYVTGRVFWGALTMRMTRTKCEQENRPATNSTDYYDLDNKKGMGYEVHQKLAYTYFYPAIYNKDTKDYDITFSWKNESQFRRRFLSSYTSTALVYPQQAADEGLLHEVEFISPRTLDKGEQVYLVGYVFEKEGCNLNWRDACKRLQFGGERGYGWGDVACDPQKDIKEIEESTPLFDKQDEQTVFDGSGGQPIIQSKHLLAHASSTGLTATGEIEPLVGREWKSNESINQYAGQYVAFSDLCWMPGSVVGRSLHFVIRDFGIWHSPT